MPWSGSKSGVPENAVVGGFDGSSLYFARAETNAGTIIGRYSPSSSEAYFAYNNKAFTSVNFEVSHSFQNSNQT